MVTYPETLDKINNAQKVELARWSRFLILPSNKDEEDKINLILKRFMSLGGFTPQLSKKIGWDPHLPYKF